MRGMERMGAQLKVGILHLSSWSLPFSTFCLCPLLFSFSNSSKDWTDWRDKTTSSPEERGLAWLSVWFECKHSESYLKQLISWFKARASVSKWQRFSRSDSVNMGFFLELRGRASVKYSKSNLSNSVSHLGWLVSLDCHCGNCLCVCFFPYYGSLITMCSCKSTCACRMTQQQ